MAHTPSPVLHYTAPATAWTEALPLGNGRLGAMVHGGVHEEHLQINDGTAWSGSPVSETLEPRADAATAAAAVEEARGAIRERRFADAVEPLQRVQHRHSQAYVPFGDLRISIAGGTGEPEGYVRSLDLAGALHSVSYRVDGHEVRREAFISHPDGVGVLTVHTDRPDGLAIGLAPSTPLAEIERTLDADAGYIGMRLPAAVSPHVDGLDEPIEFSDDVDRSMLGVLAVGWTHDGTPDADRGLAAAGVHRATIVFASDTTFTAIGEWPSGDLADLRERAERRVATALALPVEDLRERQRADHAALFDRAGLSTWRPGQAAPEEVPLDARLRRGDTAPGGTAAADPALVGLLYDYGRYLLISSSRPGGVPANLQGIWNDRMQPPWSSNYTTNINVEMNYWQAEVAALPECAEPLFDLIDALAVSGRETAQRLYGAPGWVAHHNTDVWAYTQPVGWGRHSPRWAFWPMGGPWLCQHLVERIRFGGGAAFARDRAWAPMRSAAEFVLHWLTPQPDGSLGTIPSTSPENEFLGPDGLSAPAGVSSGMDLALATDLLTGLVAVAALIGEEDDAVVLAAVAALPRIPGPTIAADGRVAEWPADLPEVEPDHRHVSHLWPAYPGAAALDGDFGRAVSASLDARGDASTGWSLVWKLALRARLGQAAKVADLLRLVYGDMQEDRGMFGGGIYPNLFTAHPPFQIDANLGFVAAVTEAIMQSHAGRIELLPAVPADLPAGRLRGAIARPGVRVDVEWTTDEQGVPTPVRVALEAVSEPGAAEHEVTWRGRTTRIDLADGAKVTLEASDFA